MTALGTKAVVVCYGKHRLVDTDLSANIGVVLQVMPKMWK